MVLPWFLSPSPRFYRYFIPIPPRYYCNFHPHFIPIPMVLPWFLSPSPRFYRYFIPIPPRYYCNFHPHYCGFTAITADLLLSPSPCSSLNYSKVKVSKISASQPPARHQQILQYHKYGLVSHDMPVYSPSFRHLLIPACSEGRLRLSKPGCLVPHQGGLPIEWLSLT